MLQRRLRLLQAVSLNMSMMVGIGPFITIPTFVATMGGPQAMVGWILGALIALSDGLVWCELAAAFPGSGGTYHFFDAAYGQSPGGRLIKFLFVWQFFFSGPLEVATGAIGLSQYAAYFLPVLERPAWSWQAFLPWLTTDVTWGQVAAMGVMVLVTTLAYRRIEVAGRVMVILWIGMLITVGAVIAAGLSNFNSALAFDFPPDAWRLTGPHLSGLGMALAIAMYDYLGYYQICYLGDEVADPSRTIPRSILISVSVISLVYLTMNLSILGVLPWREVIRSQHVASDMMLHLYGSGAGGLITLMIVWTALASTFAALLGYSRVPYASARAGHFFRFFSRIHPTGQFPHRSLLLISGVAAIACLFKLEIVITALLTSRILIQFVGQIATVFILRARPDSARSLPFKMPLFPLPAMAALLGWLFIFGTSGGLVLFYGLFTMQLGVEAFQLWEWYRSRQKPASDHGASVSPA
jgi:amino acid transporter